MNSDFHYYATYCAALIAGYSKKDSEKIAFSANFVDYCTATLLKSCGAPVSAATTQSPFELADLSPNILSLREITRIWASFHFLPGDLYAPINKGCRNYRNKFRLICKPNSKLLIDTIHLADNSSLEAIGIAMHILADSWAHQNFAGTPSLVINNINNYIYEIVDDKEYKISFSHNPARKDDIDARRYTNSVYSWNENNIMNLGHGRMGHLPDLCFIKYKYMPAWGNYDEIIKDNQSDYLKAFAQMVYALKYFRSKDTKKVFKLNQYDNLTGYKKKITSILKIRQLSAEDEWKHFAQELCGSKIAKVSLDRYVIEYQFAKNKKETAFNSFIKHALKQKSLITNRICNSKNNLAGYSLKFDGRRLRGLKDYWELFEDELKEIKHEQTK